MAKPYKLEALAAARGMTPAEFLDETLKAAGNMTEAAAVLDMGRATFYRALKRNKLTFTRKLAVRRDR